MKKKLKILIGVTEIAGHIDDYSLGYKKLGCEVISIVRQKSPCFYHINYNFVIDNILPNFKLKWNNFPYKIFRRFFLTISKYAILFWYCLQVDLFHIIWPSNFVYWRLFLPLVKLFNPKLKIILIGVGDDIRWRRAMVQEFKIFKFPLGNAFLKRTENDDINRLKNVLERNRVFEKYADIIYTTPVSAQMLLRPHKHYYLPINLDLFRYNDKSNDIPIVVHACNDRSVKGSYFIKDIMDKIKEENVPYNFLLIEKMPNNELLNLLSNSDIVLYMPYGITTGKFGLEALASGCILLTGFREDYYSYPPAPPIIKITPDNLYKKIKHILKNYENKKELKKKGRKWVEKYADHKTVCKHILNDIDKLSTGKEIKYEYYPNFFREKYKPELGKQEINLLNKYNIFIRKFKWYKNYVEPGEREGLIF